MLRNKWLSLDKKREFFNPYSFVGGNPTNYFDPNGLERFTIQVNAFINDAIFNGPFGRTFQGDNRLAGEPGSSRLSVTAVIETNPDVAPMNPLIGKVTVKQGASTEIKTGETETGIPRGSVIAYRSSSSKDNAVVRISGSAKDPIGAPKMLRGLNFMVPSLDFDINFEIEPGQQIKVNGKTDAFPLSRY